MNHIFIYFNNINEETNIAKSYLQSILPNIQENIVITIVDKSSITEALKEINKNTKLFITIEVSNTIFDNFASENGVLFKYGENKIYELYNNLSRKQLEIVDRKMIYTNNTIPSLYFVFNSEIKDDIHYAIDDIIRTLTEYFKPKAYELRSRSEKYKVITFNKKLIISTYDLDNAKRVCNMHPNSIVYDGNNKIIYRALSKIDPLNQSMIEPKRREFNKKPEIKKRRIGGNTLINRF